MGSLRKRSFGMITLVLALLATVRGGSIVAGLLLMIPAFQVIVGKPAPTFPGGIASRPFPTRHLAALLQRAIPVLRDLERMIHPRWTTPLEATKRLVGIVVIMLGSAEELPMRGSALTRSMHGRSIRDQWSEDAAHRASEDDLERQP